MDFEKIKKVVETLNEKAVHAADSTDALKFSQAALNSANTYYALMSFTTREPGCG